MLLHCFPFFTQGFNTDIEEIKQIHTQFSVPDVTLKKRIYDRICDVVLPKYTEFLKRYVNIQGLAMQLSSYSNDISKYF